MCIPLLSVLGPYNSTCLSNHLVRPPIAAARCRYTPPQSERAAEIWSGCVGGDEKKTRRTEQKLLKLPKLPENAHLQSVLSPPLYIAASRKTSFLALLRPHPLCPLIILQTAFASSRHPPRVYVPTGRLRIAPNRVTSYHPW